MRARVMRLSDARCQEAGRHVALTQGRFILGSKRSTIVTELCIFCNRWERKWKEIR